MGKIVEFENGHKWEKPKGKYTNLDENGLREVWEQYHNPENWVNVYELLTDEMWQAAQKCCKEYEAKSHGKMPVDDMIRMLQINLFQSVEKYEAEWIDDYHGLPEPMVADLKKMVEENRMLYAMEVNAYKLAIEVLQKKKAENQQE